MRIGLFIGGTPNREIDCRNVTKNGNPGIGGTEYEFIMLATFLHSYCMDHPDWELIVFQGGRYNIPNGIRSVIGISKEQMPYKCKELDIATLIIDSRWPLPDIKRFNTSCTKLIVWCHCVGSIYRHLLFARWKAVAKVVFVSKGHLLNFIDNPVYRKSSYAFNAVSDNQHINNLRNANPFSNRPHDVVYMGALDESKGFHVLAKVWKDVLKLVPDARLHVIGSANLYGASDTVGKLGITAQRYENTFASYLTDENEQLHPSVILHGQLADEKYDIMSKCRVAVPNPCGKTETFCICAVEMQQCGCRVVTKYASGYIDTIPTPSNILVNKTNELADAIAASLMMDSFNWNENILNIRENFLMDAVGKRWIKIITSVINGKPIANNLPLLPQFKKRRLNSQLRRFLPFLPPVGFLSDTLIRLQAVVSRICKNHIK